jgi:hypothetical protein
MEQTWLRRFVAPVAIVALSIPSISQEPTKAENVPYRNPKLATEDRVADLLSRMTLEEKVEEIAGSESSQFSIVDPTGTFTDETAQKVRSSYEDADLGLESKKAAILRNGVQHYFKQRTRLSIPHLFMGEVLHGMMEYGNTSFPRAIGLAGTWVTNITAFAILAPGEASPSAAAVSDSGLVSNFDDLKVAAKYGFWRTTSDAEMGGKSSASMQAVEGGANGTRGALRITGELVPGAEFTWAGVFFHPGSSPEDAVDLSKKKTIAFWAKGDGKGYSIAVQTQSNAGSIPTILPFVAGPEWKQSSIPISNFDTDGHDVTGIAFARSQESGTFEFELDELEIK